MAHSRSGSLRLFALNHVLLVTLLLILGVHAVQLWERDEDLLQDRCGVRIDDQLWPELSVVFDRGDYKRNECTGTLRTLSQSFHVAVLNVTKDAPLVVTNVIRDILSRNSLREAHILSSSFGHDLIALLERQVDLRSLSVAGFEVDLSKMMHLEKLSLESVVGERMLASIRKVGPRLTYIRAPGSMLHQLDKALFTKRIEVSSIVSSELDVPHVVSKRSVAFESLTSVVTRLTIGVNSSWTNQMFYDAMCGNPDYPGSLSSLTLSSTGTFTTLAWPDCTIQWTALTSLTISVGPIPALNQLPRTIQTLVISSANFASTSRLVDIISYFAGSLQGLFLTRLTPKLTLAPDDLSAHPNYMQNLTRLSAISTLTIASSPNAEFIFRELSLNCPRMSLINFDGNGFSGTLPMNLFSNLLPALALIDLRDNLFTGTVPHLVGSLISAYLLRNQFEAWISLPSNAVDNSINTIVLTGNLLTTLPDDQSFWRMRNLGTVDISNNPTLSRPIPQIWPNQTYFDANPTWATPITTFFFIASGCALTGTLPSFPQGLLLPRYSASLSFSGNQLNGTIPPSWANVAIASLDLSHNVRIRGTIPPDLTPSRNGQLTLNVFNTSVWGLLPDLSRFSINTLELTLGCTQLGVCNRAYTTQPPRGNSACQIPLSQSSCQSKLIGGITCSLYNDSLCTPLIPKDPDTCPEPHPLPVDRWTCIGNTWTSSGLDGSTTPVIIISSPVVVTGNLSVPQITFHGITGVTIEVYGCAQLPEKVIVVLSEKEFEDLRDGKKKISDLIKSSGCDLNSGKSVPVTVSTSSKKKRSCEKINASIVPNGQTMQGMFQLDKSACNRWWIAVVATIGGLILIALIVGLVFAVRAATKKPRGPL